MASKTAPIAQIVKRMKPKGIAVGRRLVITSTGTKVYDHNGICRVQLGDLSL